MNVVNGIVYAYAQKKPLSIISIRVLDNYKLWIRFSTGETKIFDFEPLLNNGVFTNLKNKEYFNSVYIDYGIPVWGDGEIDIAPERLYYDGVSVPSINPL